MEDNNIVLDDTEMRVLALTSAVELVQKREDLAHNARDVVLVAEKFYKFIKNGQ